MVDLISQAGFLVLGIISLVLYARGKKINDLFCGLLFVVIGSQYGIRYEVSSLEETLLQQSLLQQKDGVCVQNTQE